MFWEENETPQEKSGAVIDLLFSLKCKELPVIHEVALYEAMLKIVPWIEKRKHFAIHNIHLAGSQNGWERPDPDLGQKLILSKRTKMTIRCAEKDSQQLQDDLLNQTLDVAGHPLTVGKAKIRNLSKLGTVFCRNIILKSDDELNEDTFLTNLANELAVHDIKITKALCGLLSDFETHEGTKKARSVMIANIKKEQSIYLQENGIGDWQHLGCGIFLPHKGIEAVKTQGDED
jgi:CRISPR-associated protein Cas6